MDPTPVANANPLSNTPTILEVLIKFGFTLSSVTIRQVAQSIRAKPARASDWSPPPLRHMYPGLLVTLLVTSFFSYTQCYTGS